LKKKKKKVICLYTTISRNLNKPGYLSRAQSSGSGKKFSVYCGVKMSCGADVASYPVSTKSTFPGDKAATA